MFCQKCGGELKDNASFCNFCGESTGTEIENIKNNVIYGSWMRGLSTIFAAIILVSITSGLQWYFESGSSLVLFCEFAGMLIGVFLLLLGLFPDNICKRLGIDTQNAYTGIVVILIIIWFIIIEIEPEPAIGWLNY